MALKISKPAETETTTTELTTKTETGLATLGLSELVQAAAPTDEYFPRVKLLWAIEAQNDPERYEMAHVGKLLIQNGAANELLPADSIVTLVASRNAIRKSTKTEDGEFEYQVAYQQMSSIPNQTGATYTQNLGNPEWKQGVLMLVGIIRPDGSMALAEWPAFKADVAYFYGKLQPMQLTAKLGLRLKDCNHMKNLKANKAGTGSYLDAKKWTAYEQVQLSAEQVQGIAKLVAANESTFTAWLKK